MILQSVVPIYTTEHANNQIRVVEWRTYVDEQSHKVYRESREYVIHLYDKQGNYREYSNKSNIDVKA